MSRTDATGQELTSVETPSAPGESVEIATGPAIAVEAGPAPVSVIAIDETRESPPPTDPACPRRLARAPDSLRTRAASVIGLLLLACAASIHGFRPNHVLAPTDALKTFAPWKAPGQDFVPGNSQLLDQTVQFVPWTIYAVDRFRAGEFPLWNPHAGAGQPFLANGQSAVFYPTILLHWAVPETWSWTISAVLRLFVAGLGTWMLAGVYGLRGWPRFLAGAAFMLCGFNAVWLNHPQTNVMPLLPWAVLSVELMIRRVTLVRFTLASIVFALQFLGGHPATSAHLLLTCGLVAALRLFFGRKPDAPARSRWAFGALASFGAIALGFALAAVQWLPLIDYANHSGARIVREQKLAEQGIISTDPRYLIGLVFPYANGYAPDRVTPFEIRNVTKLQNANELAAGFVGTVPLLLAIFVIVRLFRGFLKADDRRATVIVWSVVGALAMLIAIKFPVIDHLVRLVPVFNVAQNARLLAVTALALAILAGFGLEAVINLLRAGVDTARLRKHLIRIAGGIAALGILIAVGLLIFRGPILKRGYARAESDYSKSDEHERTLEQVRALVPRVHTALVLTGLRLLIPAGMIGGVIGILWLARRRPDEALEPATEAAAARDEHPDAFSRFVRSPLPWVSLAALDLLAFAIPFNPGGPQSTYYPRGADAPETIRKLQDLPPARFAGTFRTLIPESSTPYGLSDIRSYDALAPERYYQFWAHPKLGALPREMQGYLSRLENSDHPAWRLFNLGYLVTATDQPAPPADQWKLVPGTEDAFIYRRAAVRPRAWVVPKAEFFSTTNEALDRVATLADEPPGFDPDRVAIIDGPVPDDVRNRPPGSVSAAARAEIVPPRNADEARPEIVRVRVTGGGGGWLVLADAFAPGWEAVVINEATNTGQEAPIHPAYGALRAVPLPPAAGPQVVEFTYRPMSWRAGAAVSAMSACVLLLMIGAATFRGVRRDPAALPKLDRTEPS